MLGKIGLAYGVALTIYLVSKSKRYGEFTVQNAL
jgi:hypothetical protein